ncbi:hypothetical protein [Confluentibacter sediminis]|uniref:hypothetical protein n=1 Tax=Confluentibacter sediminis TaxID=2219045 RepID=UPI000DACE70A|nr:hypothetical protein [Confluentibacter sediminis]
MKKILLKIFFLSIPIIILGIILEIALRNIPNDYSVKNKYLTEHATEIETLILGSSEATFGLDPKYFISNTFNSSYFAQDLNYDLLILKKFENKLKNLKTIILPISYITLYDNIELDFQSLLKNYKIYFGIKANTLSELKYNSELLNTHFSINKGYLYSYYIKRDPNNPLIFCTELGWCKTSSALNKDISDIDAVSLDQAIEDNSTVKKNEKLISENLSNLNSIINICRKNNINLVLFSAPTYKTYYDKIDKDILINSINSSKDLAKTYEKCIYLDYSKGIGFNSKDYFDGVHLNKIGAKKLSLKLNQVIEDGF